jgi:hypothetical protein
MAKATKKPEAPKPPRYEGFTAKVNRIAKLKSYIAKYEKRRDELQAELKDNGLGVYEGTIVDANIFESSRSFVDLAAMVADKKISKKMIEKYTKEGPKFLVCKIQGKQNG